MVLPHRKKDPIWTIKAWVQDGNSRRKSTRTKTSKEAKWCPKYKCCKWRNAILRRGEVTHFGQNVSWWSIKSQKTNRYPFEGSVRAFQRHGRFVKLSYGLALAGKIKIWGFSFNKGFSLQIHSFENVTVVNLEGRKGPKSCSAHSE